MSVFDLPRLHFAGTALTRLPTGPRGGLLDLATNTALTADGEPFPAHRPPGEYHAHLDRLGRESAAKQDAGAADSAAPGGTGAGGRPSPGAGGGCPGKGAHFSGNGHFSVDARIVGVEWNAEGVDTGDPVVGRAVDLWGHYNEYLATTVNRARVFDLDPASAWTTTLMVGQFGFGRDGRSHDVGYMATGAVSGFHPPRWHDFAAPGDEAAGTADGGAAGDGAAGRGAGRPPLSVVHQFAVPASERLSWSAEADTSPAARLLRTAATAPDADGLVVQFALLPPAVGGPADGPARWRLRGTIAPWRPDEPRTYPAGRLLVPDRRTPGRARGPLRPLTLAVGEGRVTLNMVTAVPEADRADAGDQGAAGGLGDLELRTADSDRLVARLPRRAYLGPDTDLTGGLVTVPTELPAEAVAGEGLLLVGAGPDGPVVQLREREVNVQVDDAALVLEHPRGPEDSEHDTEVPVRSFVRGRPAAVEGIGVRQFFNPRALPRDPAARAAGARCGDVETVRLRPGRRDASGAWSGFCSLDTDAAGRGWFTLRGAAAGTARVLLSTGPDDLPCAVDRPGSAALAYDHADALGFWPGAGHLSVRVLPDDWHLAGTGPEEATFDLVYREVFAPYEHLYSFMKEEVFSLADRCKVETYAKLIWQMCDPRNKAKTYYMPPTRDLSEPKARLLLSYLRARQAPEAVLLPGPAPKRTGGRVSTRGELVRLLREAAAIELAVMVQYLYAAYSVPTHGAGLEYVRRGLWTPGQLRLACGDGGETREEGIRGMLMGIAREEMIHFLLVNNILVAVGEPFHVPRIDFGTLNHELPVPLDFCLERLGPGSVERFTAIERPEELTGEVLLEGGTTAAFPASGGERHPYASLSELYAEIREGLKRVPDLFLVDRGRGGGEHHLFLRESVDRRHPDYQLEVDDLASALFAVDVITEQGEGGVLGPRDGGAEESHYASFLRIGELLRGAPAGGRPGSGPWNPAYPVLRNPTLGRGSLAMEAITDPEARTVAELFNRAYAMALRLMVQHFGERPDGSLRRSDLMNAAIDMMTGLMRPLAELLVTLPSGRRGTTAGPTFELDVPPAPVPRPDVARRGIALHLDQLAAECVKCPSVPARVGEMSAFWADHFRPR
ncbi:ferritin-like domain-containing protein [Streptomyces sp. NPDC006984]|uniref:ferritin-like domain-containing protein n=1 Tax=Streptomyces sp. NPDC006984 TaxID=3155463 RepID=UPI0033D1C690